MNSVLEVNPVVDPLTLQMRIEITQKCRNAEMPKGRNAALAIRMESYYPVGIPLWSASYWTCKVHRCTPYPVLKYSTSGGFSEFLKHDETMIQVMLR